MGKTATARISYGFIIAQPKVLEVLQKLQNSTEKVTKFQYGDGAELLEELLYKHLAERGIGEQIFEMVYLTSGEYDFEGLAILYKGIDGESLTVWGMGSRTFEPLLWDKEPVHDADTAFERLSEDSLFKELDIMVDPGWLFGCDISY